MQRPLVLLFLLALLGGCGDDDSRPEPEDVPAPVEQSAPAPVGSEPAEAPPDLQIELAAPEESADPALPDVQISIPEPQPAPRPAPARRPEPPKPEEVELAEPELDLHLPDELVEALMPAPSAEAARLLPPLFEKGKASQSMQIGGRLISGEDDDEALIEGAEIRFEFKR
ncbi:hypothetical protein NAV11_07565 [Pseudomonas songnenensis]|jgi:hypothetical protein|uniref:Translation initiation factor 2 n=1 Tax=Pseudomonas songnenensis TaxID=1176259 RepID=A0ABX9UXR3_9PSED|nr:hypothetical protein [Pseudomonas songnenensis]MCQ4299768.1 hypothetical protein [Pseudomonas songnenensis]RMH98193.1 hypothetical protein EA798_07245 [Pseudomonas songnenensis]